MSAAEAGPVLRVVRSGQQNTESTADGLAESIPTPTLNPGDALTDMRLEKSLCEMLQTKLEPFRLALSDQTAEVTYTGVSHGYTLAKRPGLEFAILQIPRWVIGNDNNMGTLVPLGSAFSGMTVRIVSQKQDAPAFGLRRVLKDWQKHYGIEAQFVAWSYVKNLAEGKFGAGEILELELAPDSAEASAQGAARDGKDGAGRDDSIEEEAPTGNQRDERVVKIFLASSEELREDRDEFDLYFRQQNDRLRDEGVYLEVVRWENFLDAMSETRLQDEYNSAVRKSDVFVSLFMTKTGKFTEEEFDNAHQSFVERGKPRIYTFFKKTQVDLGRARREDVESLWDFQERLKKLQHFYTHYDNIEHLKRQFRDQLDRLLEDPDGG